MSKASNLAGFSTSISPPANLNVGVITATSFVGSGSGLTGVGIGTDGSVNTTGIITATSFVGSGSGLTGVGIGTDGSVNTTGIITATSFFGSGSGLTGVGIGTDGSVNTTGIITATSVNDSIGNVRDIPQNSQISAYQLQSTDAGKHISITTGGITVPSSVFSVGDAVSIYNNSVSNQTITQGASVTLRQVGTANTGNRTLAQYGLATVLCVASNTFAISGGGLS
jgi:hypothetical protein